MMPQREGLGACSRLPDRLDLRGIHFFGDRRAERAIISDGVVGVRAEGVGTVARLSRPKAKMKPPSGRSESFNPSSYLISCLANLRSTYIEEASSRDQIAGGQTVPSRHVEMRKPPDIPLKTTADLIPVAESACSVRSGVVLKFWKPFGMPS